MIKLSANLGFLWQELSLPDAIRRAAEAGFSAVECHWPYAVPAQESVEALAQAGIPMIGLNTDRGNTDAGENGLSALPEQIGAAREAIDQALAYAAEVSATGVHVMAGITNSEKAHETFLANLEYAADKAARLGITILIEPLNHHDAPGYFLQTTAQAQALLKELGRANVKLMFDCYHVQIMEGDVTRRLHNLASIIGHIQIASVPARAEPNLGELNYHHILAEIEKSGYTGYVGAEYKPTSTTDDGLSWMSMIDESA